MNFAQIALVQMGIILFLSKESVMNTKTKKKNSVSDT
jgi:hypothetical protein